MSVNEDKIDIIIKRDLERRLDAQKRKNDKDQLGAKNEKLEVFEQTFMDKYNDIEMRIKKCECVPKLELSEAFNSISKDTLTLQKYIAASNIFLRTYDVKKFNNLVQNLTNKSKELEERLLPKKRFAFKNKNKNSNEIKQTNKSSDEVDCNIRNEFSFLDENFFGFLDKNGEVLVMTDNEILSRDVRAHNLENCQVKFLGAPSTLHLSSLKNCEVLSGPVSTSIFAENCENCTFVIACQQLRLHSSNSIKIYIHVTSRAIMEDCTKILVAPYNLKYEGIENHFRSAGLDPLVNHWDSFDDFNWLNIEHHSPNWNILPEESRIKEFNV